MQIFSPKRVYFPDGIIAQDVLSSLQNTVNNERSFRLAVSDVEKCDSLSDLKTVLKAGVISGLIRLDGRNLKTTRPKIELISEKVDETLDSAKKVYEPLIDGMMLGFTTQEDKLCMGIGNCIDEHIFFLEYVLANPNNFNPYFNQYLRLFIRSLGAFGFFQPATIMGYEYEDLLVDSRVHLDRYFDGKITQKKLLGELSDDFRYVVGHFLLSGEEWELLESDDPDINELHELLYKLYDTTIEAKTEFSELNYGRTWAIVEYNLLKNQFSSELNLSGFEKEFIQSVQGYLDFVLFKKMDEIFDNTLNDHEGAFDMYHYQITGVAPLTSELIRNVCENDYQNQMQGGECIGYMLPINHKTTEVLKSIKELNRLIDNIEAVFKKWEIPRFNL